MYTFASDTAFIVVLTQQTKDKNETPIAFMSSSLQGVELKYLDIDKQAYAVYKDVKHFKPCILKSHTKVVVSHPLVRSVLVQKEVGGKRGNWITTLQEYDLEIKPTRLMKGQGLCKLAAESDGNQL